MKKKYVFVTQGGYINLHPWAMLLNVLAFLSLVFLYTPLSGITRFVCTAWLYWWVLGYLPVFLIAYATPFNIWDPFWLYELWDETPTRI